MYKSELGHIFQNRIQHIGSHSSYGENQAMMQDKFWGQKAELKIALFLFGAAC